MNANSPLILLFIIMVVFLVYFNLKPYLFKEVFTSAILVPEKRNEITEENEKTIKPSGPNSPSQSSPQEEVAILHSQQSRYDSLEEKNQDTNSYGKNILYPERFYRKAPEAKENLISKQAGVSGKSEEESNQNYQRYSNDLIQNSGEFMEGGVYASDVESNSSFSHYE